MSICTQSELDSLPLIIPRHGRTYEYESFCVFTCFDRFWIEFESIKIVVVFWRQVVGHLTPLPRANCYNGRMKKWSVDVEEGLWLDLIELIIEGTHCYTQKQLVFPPNYQYAKRFSNFGLGKKMHFLRLFNLRYLKQQQEWSYSYYFANLIK